ncbi:MAG: response regulator transcription factor [Bacteroidia bacterium]|nr:response regulator transcription factor [Bacteroidia bacterium]
MNAHAASRTQGGYVYSSLMDKPKILVVEDEQDLIDLISYNLRSEGYEVYSCRDGGSVLEQVRKVKPDLILLDIMLPKIDGVEVCRQLRKLTETRATPIVFLTARSEEYSEIAAFDAGADDYITKPVKPRVLVSRIKAILRRGVLLDVNSKHTDIRIGDLEIVWDEFLVYRNGIPISLPKKEFELLYFLASRPGKVFTREALLAGVWGGEVYVVPRTIDVHIRKLREKLGEKYIQTVKGVGYKFNADSE